MKTELSLIVETEREDGFVHVLGFGGWGVYVGLVIFMCRFEWVGLNEIKNQLAWLKSV